jgi:gliding motility-associated-like protein
LTISTLPSNGTATVNDNGTPNDPSDDTVTYTPNVGFTGSDLFYYTVCNALTPPQCYVGSVSVIVTPIPDLLIHNAFSANNDGVNEVFQIDNIENYKNNTVCIFNRWGVMVYDAKGYNNDSVSFIGESDGRVTISRGEQLPEGTYFYVVKVLDNKGSIKLDKAGYLYFTRQ